MPLELTPPSVKKLIQFSLQNVSGPAEFREVYTFDRNRMSRHSKRRRIMVPNKTMKQLQRNLRDYLRNLPVDYTYATAYREGCNTKENILRHSRSRYFYLFDLQGAFDQVNGERLARMLVEYVYKMAAKGMKEIGRTYVEPTSDERRRDEEELHGFLKQYCLLAHENGLPQGGPASQDLFNIYMAVLVDQELGAYCRKNNFVYSRYGDDLAISSRKRPIGKVFRRKIREILYRQGMSLSHRKCEVLDLARIGNRSILVNGVRLKWGEEVFAPGHFIRQTRSVLQAAIKSGDEKLYFRAQGLGGCIRYIAKGRELTRTEQKVLWDLERLSYVRRVDDPNFSLF